MTHTLRTPTVPGAALVAMLVATLLAGCVTINIYFPASAAEKAADTIIDEVWQMKGKPAPDAAATSGASKEKTP
jgi:hypothetical protein